MNIILLENIEKVGLKYEVVTVKGGYGRNYLIPQGLALTANRQNLGKLSGIKRQQAAKDNILLDTYKGWAKELEGKSVRFVVKAGDSGRLFGSITSNMMAEKLAELGVPVERRRIIMPAEVKNLGEYSVKLDLHPSLDVRVPFEVVSESQDMTSARAVAAAVAEDAVPVTAPIMGAPAMATEAVAEVAAPVVEDAVEAAAPAVVEEVVAEAAAPVAETVEEVAAPVIEAAEESVAEVVADATETAGDVADEITDKTEEA